MNGHRLDQIVASALAAGILPPQASTAQADSRPWPVVLMTAFGAWLAAVPLLIVLLLAFNSVLLSGPGTYVVALCILAAALVCLRWEPLPFFVEQLAVPTLLVGGSLLGFGLFRDASTPAAAGLMSGVSLLCALLARRDWLRFLLGAAACGLALMAVTPGFGRFTSDAWLGLQLAVVAWLVLHCVANVSLNALGSRSFTAIDAIGIGWVLMALAGLAWWAGVTFLAGSSLGFSGGGDVNHAQLWQQPGQNVGSLVMAAGAAAWTLKSWPSLRRWWSALVVLILVGIAALMPTLGAVLLLLAVFATGKRWRLTVAAGLAAAWIVGAFYYQLNISLADKALIVFGAGATLATLAWHALKDKPSTSAPRAARGNPRIARFGIALSAVAVLVVANVGIWQKQTLIAEGKPVFIELAPADPRSLMQGDFMRLDFQLLGEVNRWQEQASSRIIVKVDSRGIGTPVRPVSGQPLGLGEIVLQLRGSERGAAMGTDAWYFKEGDGDRWVRAKYGEFRVDANGDALLVTLRGPNLEPL